MYEVAEQVPVSLARAQCGEREVITKRQRTDGL